MKRGIVIYSAVLLINLKLNAQMNIKELSPDEGKTLIKEKNGKLNSEYARKYSFNVYVLNNGTVVTNKEERYALYESLSELDTALASFATVKNILFDKNPYNDSFPIHSKDLGLKLLEHLDVHREHQMNIKTLIELDSVYRNVLDRSSFFEKYFLNIVALIGEIIIQERNIAWTMKLSKDKKTWNPCLKYNGHLIPVAIYVFESFNGDDDSIATPFNYTYERLVRELENVDDDTKDVN